MAALQDEVKAFIVQALACFDTPSQVAVSVKEQFDVEVTKQQCEAYDPTKYVGRSLSAKWVTLFHDTRKRFREDTADIPIANRAFRLRALGRLAEKAESSKNARLTLQILEQAAKEAGDMYVNRQAKVDGGHDDAPPSRVEVTVVDARKRDADA